MKNINKNNDRWKSIWANFLDKTEENMLLILSERNADSIRETMTSDAKFRDELHQNMCSRLSKAMNKIMSNSTKQSPFEQIETSTKESTTSYECRTPERVTEQVKIDPFGVSLSNRINSANTSHANKFKPTFSTVLDPFGSDEIDGTTVCRTNKWKKVPEVGSIVNGSLKITSKHKKDEFDPPSKRPQIDRLKFYCLYCTNNEPFLHFQTAQNVINHWWTKHSTETPQRPFRFFVSDMLKCFYCHEINSAINIKQHHHDFHSDGISMVAIADNNRFECGICKYVGKDLIKHFESFHSDVIRSPAFNPTKISDETMSELLNIDIHKRFKCKSCELIFETGSLILQHFLEKHTGTPQQKNWIQLSSDMKNINYICGGCNQEIMSNNYLDHLATHLSKYECLGANCSFSVESLKEMLDHNLQVHRSGSNQVTKIIDQSAEIYFKTKMIFGNGLVLEKFNLMNTKLDDSANYSNFINHIRIKQFNDLQIRLIEDKLHQT